MAWTQTDLDKLSAAIAKGVRSVTYQSGSVTYQSLADMLLLRDVMSREVNGSSNVNRVVGGYDSGLGGGYFGPGGCGRW